MNELENKVIIDYTAVARYADDGSLYAVIPMMDAKYITFTNPKSYEAKWIHHALVKGTRVAQDLIQLYSGDYIPSTTQDQGGLLNSLWTVTKLSRGLVNVVGTYDLDAHRKK